MKILLIDHHELFREGLRYVLQGLPGGVDEILEAADFPAGLKLAQQQPNLILLELHTPECAGAISVKMLRQHYPHIPIVVLSSEDDSKVINQVLSYGASGYVCKSASAVTLLGALTIALSDSIYVPIQMLPLSRITHDKNLPQSRPGNSSSREFGLTKRQKHILSYLTKGLSNKEISVITNVSEGTVKVHIASIFQALRVNKRSHAAQIAMKLGLA